MKDKVTILCMLTILLTLAGKGVVHAHIIPDHPTTGQCVAQLSVADQQEMIGEFLGNIKSKNLDKKFSDYKDAIQNHKIDQQNINLLFSILSNTYEVNVHRMRGSDDNETYTHEYGHCEGVYDKSGNIVQDPINGFSYNYFSVKEEPLKHFLFDMYPWLLWGSGPEDPTFPAERIDAYAKDFEWAILYTMEHPDSVSLSHKVENMDEGQIFSLATFLMATDGGDLLFQLFEDSKQDTPNQKVNSIIDVFKKNFIELYG